MMKLTKRKLKLLFTLILAFHIMSAQAEVSASRDDADLRVLIVGMRGDSRLSAAEILSGRTDSGQEDREIVKTPVMTDEGRRMMLVTGPNLCEEDTARQSFTTALFLSAPGPHAVLMLLNLEDQESEQCDIVSRAQELLGAEVLQYCIVLLQQNQQERLTGASRGIAGEMINACGGRFHMIRDSEPKPAQTAALLAEIHKLVWLNADGFYSVLTQELKTEETSRDVHEEKQLFSLKYDNSVEIARWILLILLNAALIFSKGRHEHFYLGEILFALVSFTVTLRNILNPNVSVPFNLIVSSTFAIAATYYDLSNSRQGHQIIMFFIMIFAFPSIVFISGLGLTLGTVSSVRSWSDVLIACHAAPGVTFGAHLCTVYSITPDQMQTRTTLVFALKLFLFCSVGVTLSVGFASVFTHFFLKMAIMLLVLGFMIVYSHLKRETVKFLIFFLIFPCCCVFIGSFISFLCSVSFQYICTAIV
ncbi:GTPase IMAP family member 9-like isoform X2 [Pseudorasbora parva]